MEQLRKVALIGRVKQLQNSIVVTLIDSLDSSNKNRQRGPETEFTQPINPPKIVNSNWYTLDNIIKLLKIDPTIETNANIIDYEVAIKSY